MGNITKEAADLLGHNKLFKAKSIKIKVVRLAKKEVELQVLVENKFGDFVVFPNIDTHRPYLYEGDTLTIETDKNFKLKTRIKIE